MLNLHRLTSCTLLPRTDSCLNRKNSVTYIAKERSLITRNTCHVTTTHGCVTSLRARKTQPPLLLRVGPCLQSCCIETRWSNPYCCVLDRVYRAVASQRVDQIPIVACWTVFTELLPGNALIKFVTICSLFNFRFARNISCDRPAELLIERPAVNWTILDASLIPMWRQSTRPLASLQRLSEEWRIIKNFPGLVQSFVSALHCLRQYKLLW
jgi:hypothetical protein